MGILEGKVALITGASDGIGYSSAKLFAREGAAVVAVARRQDRLAALVNDIEKAGGQAACLAGVEYAQPVPSAAGTSDVIATFDNELPGLAGGDPAAILGSAQVNLQAVLS